MKQKLDELENKIKVLGDEQKLFTKLQLEDNKHTDNQLVAQTDIIRIMKSRLDKHDEELSLIIQSDAGQDLALDKMRTSLDNVKSQMEAHGDLMQSLDNLQRSLKSDKEEEDCSLGQTLQNILQLNKENKRLIKQLNIKEKADKDSTKEGHPDNQDFIQSLQKQISFLQSGFEDLKSKIANVCTSREKEDVSSGKRTESAQIENKFIKSEKFQKQYLPDLSSVIQAFQDCREKLSNLEINFEDVKQDAGHFNDRNCNIENKMMKIIDQINSLMLKMVQVEERTRKLELSCREVNCKMSSLESADVFLQEADRMIIEKVSVMEADLRKDDIRNYIDENLLQVSKKMDQSYMEVKSELEQHRHEFEKERKEKVKIERISNETNEHKKFENMREVSQHLTSSDNIMNDNESNVTTTHNNNNNVNTAFRLETANNNNNHNTAAKTIATAGPVWPALLALYSAFSKLGVSLNVTLNA